MSIIDDIKASINCVDVANMFGNSLSPEGGRCKSYRVDAKNKSSLQVSPDLFNDYGDSVNTPFGDSIELYQRFKNCTKAQAINDLAKSAGIDNQNIVLLNFGKQNRILDDACDFFLNRLRTNENAKAYLLKMRKIKPEVIRDLKIGIYDADPTAYLIEKGYSEEQIDESGIRMMRKRLIFPYFKNGEIKYLAGRSMEKNPTSKYFKLKRNSFNENIIWGLDSIKRNTKKIYIAEGIVDAITLYQEGYSVISAVTGRFSHIQLKYLMTLIKSIKDVSVTVCMDYDPVSGAGQKFALDMGDKLIRNGVNPDILRWSESNEKQDVNEQYQKDGNLLFLNHVMDFEEYWLRANVGEELNETELEKLMRAAKKRSSIELIKFIKKIEAFLAIDTEILAELVKKVKKPPSDAIISDNILKNDDITHREGMGWFRFAEGIWKSFDKSIINTAIHKELGPQRKASLTKSAYETIKVDAETLMAGKDFNFRKDWIAFKNCKFNLKTKKTDDNKPEDFATIMLDYQYMPSAKCPLIHKTLGEIFNDDKDSVELFYEIAGYCLSRSTKMNMAFILFGSGANGKSILLDILKILIGRENFSNVELDKLKDEKYIAPLYGKLANFASEISGNMKGCEDNFKKITAGEEVIGKLLYKDPFAFNPFSTLIFASNKFLRTTETTEGIKRRLGFIDFPMRFVDEPTKKNERKKDINLIDKLKEEIPGFFNRAVRALDKLEERGYFVLPQSHYKHMTEFQESSNPVQRFYKEKRYNFKTHPSMVKSEVYKEYQAWALDNGEYCVPGQTFWHKTEELYEVEMVMNELGSLAIFGDEK